MQNRSPENSASQGGDENRQDRQGSSPGPDQRERTHPESVVTDGRMAGGQLGQAQPAGGATPPGTPSGYGYKDGYGPLLAESHQAQVSQLLSALHRYKLTFRKHWWLIVLTFCCVLAPVTWHVYTSPPKYESKGKLWMSGKLNIKEGQLYSEELSTFIGTQVELLRSEMLYWRALDKAAAANQEIAALVSPTNRALKPFWTSIFGGAANDKDTERTFKPFKLTVTERPKSSIIELKVVGPDAEPTRLFLSTLMEEYQVYRRETRQQSSDVTLSSITEQVKQLEQELRAQQERLHSFVASNNVTLLTEQGNSAAAHVARLNRQLATLRTELNLLKLLTPEQLVQAATKTRQSKDEPEPGEETARELVMTLTGPQADFFKATQQIELLKAQRDELSSFLRPNHPKILKLDEEIARQQQIVEVFRQQSLSQMENRRQAIEVQITGLEASIAEWEAKALEASKKIAEYERIRADVQRTQGLYERLLEVIQSVDVNRTLDQESMRVMEPASPPKKVRETIKLLALGTVTGLMLCFSVLYVLNMFDDRFASITELRNQLSEVIAGHIPEVKARRDEPLGLVTENDPRQTFAESFRNLRSWILFSYRDKTRPRVLLVTSAIPSEGKTTVAANLAATLALSGSRVLLIDGDIRRAGLNRLLDCPREPGLADVLEQEARYEDAIRSTAIPTLSFMPAGVAGINPGELFLAPSMELLLARVRNQYDYIIFDSAPVMAADDTSNLAPKVDGLLFVVRADYTPARVARESLALLRQRNVNVLGLVFNRAVSAKTDSYYYYRYKSYYYYKPGKDGQPEKRRRRSAEKEAITEEKKES